MAGEPLVFDLVRIKAGLSRIPEPAASNQIIHDMRGLVFEVERLRRLLWLNHGHAGLYGDDGEMQCNMHSGYADFKRGSIESLEAHLLKPAARG